MVKLTAIKKSYTVGDNSVQALKGVDLQFRKGEFVSILGPSGCGKTTLLNIIGGLDRYDSGDIEINGKSTKDFKDADWDYYRNHSIGFVFQSYNLIGHQTVLSNVELALTLAGVSKSERKKRAKEALENVGLGAEIKKKPNQLSGGQMQRVAIARALINDPDIILADEPTGALDSETSKQVMEILAEVAKERLVIMVTHNGELAEEYSTRIIRLTDGLVVSDSNPCNLAQYSTAAPKDTGKKEKKKKTSMSLKTAFSLSLNNLFTKKGRTILTSFAGSIGIIGIALILSMSSGFQGYIDRVQEETLSTYPLSIPSTTMSGGMVSMMFGGEGDASVNKREPETIYSSTMLADMFNAIQEDVHINDLKALKDFIENDDSCKIKDVSTVQYDYGLTLDFYSADTSGGVVKADTVEIVDIIYEEFMGISYSDAMNSMSSGLMGGSLSGFSNMMSMNMWCELIDNQELLDSQYEVLKGEWPNNYNEVVLCVSENYRINEFVEFGMNLRSREELAELLEQAKSNQGIEYDRRNYSYDYLLNTRFKLVLNCDTYEKQDNKWVNLAEKDDDGKVKNEAAMKKLVDEGMEIKIVGIIRPREDSVAQSMSGVLGYSDALVEEIIRRTNESEIVKEQIANPTIDVFTGAMFDNGNSDEKPEFPPQVKEFMAKFDAETQLLIQGMLSTDPKEWQTYFLTLDEESKTKLNAVNAEIQNSPELQGIITQMLMKTEASYEGNLKKLGSVDFDTPTTINIYPIDFAAKETVKSEIDRFNEGASKRIKAQAEAEGKDENAEGEDGKPIIKKDKNEGKILYTDYLDLMLSSISTIIDAISYVLIAFVSISLIVSSIMIGVITYISVLERTKEIGILRAMGASKRDIARVFNAETLIVGLVAGLLGIGITIILNIPINIIINNIAEIGNISALPLGGGIALVLISMFLTFIAGLIPSRMAAKKDPVVALRTE